MWFWPINVKAWWLLEDTLEYLATKVQHRRVGAQLAEIRRLELSLAELSE